MRAFFNRTLLWLILDPPLHRVGVAQPTHAYVCTYAYVRKAPHAPTELQRNGALTRGQGRGRSSKASGKSVATGRGRAAEQGNSAGWGNQATGWAAAACLVYPGDCLSRCALGFMVIKTDLPSDERIGAVAVDEDAAEVEVEVAPLLVCVTINCSIYTCCSGVNTGMGVPA